MTGSAQASESADGGKAVQGKAGKSAAPAEPRFTDRPPYEQARDELITIVARLESGEPDLEESLTLWERGEHLALVAQEWLDGAQERLDAARGDEAPSA